MAATPMVVALSALVIAASMASAHARQLLADSRCTDLSVLSLDAPEITTAVRLLKAAQALQPGGLPMGVSLFLPTNTTMARLASDLGLPLTTDYMLQAYAALGPEVTGRLMSILMHHIVPVGARGLSNLATMSVLPTALNSTVLQVSQPAAGKYIVTTSSGVAASLLRSVPLPTALKYCLTAVYVIDKVLLPAASLGGTPQSLGSAFSIEPPFQPLSGPLYSAKSTYYGPDRAHGIHGGNDNIFEYIPASQYTPWDLFQTGRHFCAMSEQYLRLGYMGKVVRVTGPKASMNFVVVDLLPDRNDGQNVAIDVHNEDDWLALGGNEAVGMVSISFQLVGRASVPISPYSPWDPRKFGYT